jgi:hypothetical protein
MGRKSRWPKGTQVQKTVVAVPTPTLNRARIRAIEDQTTLQEIVAAALEEYLRKRPKGGGR